MTTLITGTNRGIGRALFDLYAAQGGAVIGTARAPAPGQLALDVTDPESVAHLAQAVTQPLDLLICNAGVLLDRGQGLDTGYPPEMWAQSFATNVTGTFLTIQALLPRLRQARGKIAIISSQMASDARAPGGTYIYRASKAAVLNLGRNLATDLRGDGIAVGIYHPGWVQTDMGGAGAAISPETSAQGLAARFAALSLETTGCFENYDGTPMPF
ncbi:MAG: SDR family oxidoreductase [Rhodobacteraceae bacterium]|nr:SDR family oxidoreductase [Paracoccaceae bacterium]